MKRIRIILYLLTVIAMASFMLYAVNAFDDLNVSGRTHLRGAVGIYGTNAFAASSTWVGMFNLDDVMDLDIGQASLYAANVYQALAGGALFVDNTSTGDTIHFADSATVVFAIENGCAAIKDAAWDVPNILADAITSKAIVATGAALGDIAIAGAGVDVTDLTVSCTVTAADEVTVVLSNLTAGAIDLAASDWYYTVIKTH